MSNSSTRRYSSTMRYATADDCVVWVPFIPSVNVLIIVPAVSRVARVDVQRTDDGPNSCISPAIYHLYCWDIRLLVEVKATTAGQVACSQTGHRVGPLLFTQLVLNRSQKKNSFLITARTASGLVPLPIHGCQVPRCPCSPQGRARLSSDTLGKNVDHSGPQEKKGPK